MLSKQKIDLDEEEIRKQVSTLEAGQQKEFHAFCVNKLKDPDTFAALAWSLPIGLHHFYLGACKRAFLDIGCVTLGLLLVIVGIFSNQPSIMIGLGMLLIVAVGAAELHSLFRSQLIVRNHNNKLMNKFLLEFKKDNLHERLPFSSKMVSDLGNTRTKG